MLKNLHTPEANMQNLEILVVIFISDLGLNLESVSRNHKNVQFVPENSIFIASYVGS